MADIERISITIEPDLLARLDSFIARTGHANRSKAIGDFIRSGLLDAEDDEREAVGVVAITFDHEQRELSDRLVHVAHEHGSMVLATTHLHLDLRNCLEMSALRGPRKEVQEFAEHVAGLKGVHHSGFVVVRPIP